MQGRTWWRSAGRETWGWAALVGAVVAAVYGRTLGGAFIWNDGDYVTAPGLRSLGGLGRIWAELGATEQYYPLLHSAFWVQYRVFGDNPAGYHGVTLALHAGAAVLFALVLRRLAVPGAWLAGVLFAVHPVHVESVAWITEQKNTLSLVFYLGSALAYLGYDDRRNRGAYGLALGLFVLSLLCKTVTATLPAALLVALWWRRGRLRWREDVAPLVPWLALGAGAGLFSSWVEQRYLGAQGGDFVLPPWERVLVAGRAFWFYLGHLVWPAGLNFVYPRWEMAATAAGPWLGVAGGLALGAGLWALRGRTRGPLAAYLLFGGSLFPVLGFVNLYGALYSWVWDHWQYLADLGPLALAAAGMVWVHRRLGLGRGGPVLAGLLIALLGALSWRHSAMFRDDRTLYRTTLARNPGCWMAHNNLAKILAGTPAGVPEALDHYAAALRIKPDYAEAHLSLADELARLPGRMPEALAHYEAALRIRPGFAEAHYNFANILATIPGRTAEALAQYEAALRIKPDFVPAHLNLANELAKLPGRTPEALAHYEAALRIRPDFVEAHNNLAGELARLPGRLPEALAHYEAAVRLDPAFAEAQANLATLLATIPGRTAEAVAHYEAALRLKPDVAETHYDLANVLAMRPGRTAEALAQYEAALRIRPDFVPAHVNLANELAKQPDRRPEALAHYEAALRLNPDLAGVHYDLAVLLSNLPGRAGDAVRQFQEALRLEPGYVAAHNNLGIALAREGRLEEARWQWEEALRLDPDFQDARRNLDLLDRMPPR